MVISKRNNIRFEDSPIRRTRLRHIILVQCEPCLVCVYVCELVCTRYMYVYVDAARLKDRSIAQKSLLNSHSNWITCLSIHKCYRQICMTTYTSIKAARSEPSIENVYVQTQPVHDPCKQLDVRDQCKHLDLSLASWQISIPVPVSKTSVYTARPGPT